MDSITLLLAQNAKVTNWLTPVWLISVGIAAGFGLVLLMMLKFWIMSLIPGLNAIGKNKSTKYVLGTILAIVYLVGIGFLYNYFYGIQLDQSLILPALFAIPVCLLVGIGVWTLFTREKFTEVWSLFTEGFLSWTNIICYFAIAFAAIGFLLAPFNGFGLLKFCDDPMGMMNSVGRMPYAGEYPGVTVTVPGNELREEDEGYTVENNEVTVDFYGQEIGWIQFKTDRKLEIAAVPVTAALPPQLQFDIPSSSFDSPIRVFRRGNNLQRLPDGKVDKFYVVNTTTKDAELTISWALIPVYAQVWIVPAIAIVVMLTYLLYLIVAMNFPKVSAIALSTFKTEISQPLFLIVMLIGLIFILGSIYLPYNTFGEDIKMYKDSGLTLIRVLGIFLAIWAASKSVAEEIEGRTALTVLSKPVGRRQFILGKYFGITLAVGLMFIALGLWFVIWTAYKPIYDGVESSLGTVDWETSFVECIHIVPGLLLCFLEVAIFVAISVAISTRMGILANFLICFSIYVLGHLTPLIAQSNFAAFEPVVVFSQLISIVFPVLDHFDVQAAINTNRPVPMVYLGWSIIYTTLYGAIAMLLALVLFEDRDLA